MENYEAAIHGIGLCIQVDGSRGAEYAATQLIQDFGAWPFFGGKPSGNTRSVQLELSGAPLSSPLDLGTRPVFKTRMGAAFGMGAQRVIHYDENSAASVDAGDPFKLKVKINSPDVDLLYEVAYCASIALLGELLDTRGYHRVHALGVSAYGKNAICIFDQKSGKSTLAMALKLYGGKSVRFFSDETPLLRGNRIFAYPNRLAIAEEGMRLFGDAPAGEFRVFKRRKFPEKRLYAWEPAELAESGRIDAVVLDGNLGHAKAALVPVSRTFALAALGRSMVVGVGVAQMAEYILRFNAAQLGRLSRIALSRAATASQVVASSRAFSFERTDDPKLNAQAIAHFLQELAEAR